MSVNRDRQAYAFIWRLGRVSIGQTFRMIAELLKRQDGPNTGFGGVESRRRLSASEKALEQHPAVREYRRLLWKGWHIDYEQMSQVYVPGAQVVMKRGRRSRVIAVDGGREGL